MKYQELSKKWQEKALQMEINYVQNCVIEIANDNKVKPWFINKDSEEVQDAIRNNEYDFETDEYTKKVSLIRTYK